MAGLQQKVPEKEKQGKGKTFHSSEFVSESEFFFALHEAVVPIMESQNGLGCKRP